jgi:hypothetical protein
MADGTDLEPKSFAMSYTLFAIRSPS